MPTARPQIPAIALVLGLLLSGEAAAQRPAKFATGFGGMVATGSPFATQAAVAALEAGGNAVDAAAAAAFTLMVVDPANASLGGRAQILLHVAGRTIAIDGATQAPAAVPPLAGPNDSRTGFAAAAIPGAPRAIAEMVARYGKRSLGQALEPAIRLAQDGFRVPARLAATMERTRDRLVANPAAAALFLKPDGTPWRAGERFRQPALARTLRRIAGGGVDSLYQGSMAAAIAQTIRAGGGYVTVADLAAYRAEPGVVVATTYRGRQVVSAGGRAWGNTLSEMLNILDHFEVGRGAPTAREAETMARIVAQALDDRPQRLGTLEPKAGGLPLHMLSSPEFAAGRAARIRAALDAPAGGAGPGSPNDDPHDTSHLSVMDGDGNAVSLTTSIGPSFGTRVAAAELGFLFGYSYRMRSDPTPNARDLTEMTPTIVLDQRRPVLVIGGAGSERIPSAIAQVLSYVIDRGWTLERAVTAPRLSAVGSRVRLQRGFGTAIREALLERGFQVEWIEAGAARHAGLVHAVAFDPATATFTGAADPGDSGSADGPARVERPR